MSLDDFIETCEGAGLFDSEGSFTIDSLAAFRKTLAAALPEPHYYLFQVLQAIIKAGGQDIKVAIGRMDNKITFQDPERYFANLDLLAGHFQKGLSVASNHNLDLMMSGMVTSLGCQIERAELYCAHQKLTVGLQGVKLEKVSRVALAPYLLFRRAQEKGLTGSWSRIWGARKEEFRIRKAFEYSVTPLQIAGLPTSPKASWRRLLEGEERFALLEVAVLAPHTPNHRGEFLPSESGVPGHPHLRLARAPEADPEGQAPAVAPSLMMLGLNSAEAPIEESLEPDSWNKRRWTFCFTNCQNEKAEIQLVRNGLTLAHREVDLGLPGLHIVGPADHLDVDATGYGVVENSVYEKTLEEAKRLVDKIRSSVSADALTQGLQALGRSADGVDLSWATAP